MAQELLKSHIHAFTDIVSIKCAYKCVVLEIPVHRIVTYSFTDNQWKFISHPSRSIRIYCILKELVNWSSWAFSRFFLLYPLNQ
jgi:hypothetical protein